MKLSITLKQFRENKNLTIQELAKISNVSQGGIGDIERGKIEQPRIRTLEKLSKALRLNQEEEATLFKSVMKDKIKYLKFQDKQKFMTLPIKGTASAGEGYINFESNIKSKVVIDRGYPSQSYLIDIRGDSMEPLISEGDTVVVDPEDVEYKSSKIYVVTYENETFIKRIECPTDDLVVLKSINSKYSDKYIAGDRRESLRIEGRAIMVLSARKI